MGILYIEAFGRSGIVGIINPECKGFAIGMPGDALPRKKGERQTAKAGSKGKKISLPKISGFVWR